MEHAKAFDLFFLPQPRSTDHLPIPLQTTVFPGITNCKILAEYDNQSMSYSFTTSEYSGSLSWGVQTNFYNTPGILKDDKTQALPLQIHWQGRSLLTNRQVVSIPISLVTQAPCYFKKSGNHSSAPSLVKPLQGTQKEGSPPLHRDRQQHHVVHNALASLPAPWGGVSRANVSPALQITEASAWLLVLSLVSSWWNCTE